MDKTLADKLRYKEGRTIIINPPEGFSLGIYSENKLEGTFDFLQLFVRNAQELETWVPQVVDKLNDEAVVWTCQ
jgi:hypothetical protein